jgi:DNA modification methylase
MSPYARHVASTKNQLFYGDNLDVLKQSIASDSIDLIYLDPPFNSNAVYNVSFANAGDAGAQIQAFDDTWTWTPETSSHYDFYVHDGGLPELAAEALAGVRALTRESPLAAYMVAMAPRLVELHRVLKSTGSLYLHCDPTASHYLKVMMDAIFGPTNFRNEIIWRRTGAHSPRRSFGPTHDVILFYSKTNDYYFKAITRPYSLQHVESRYTHQPDGRWKFTSGGNVLTGPGVSRGESGQPWRGFDPTTKNRHWAMPGFVTEQMPPGFEDLGTLDKLEAAYQAKLIDIIPGRAWPEPVRYLKPTDGNPAGDIWAYQPGTSGVLYGTDAGIDEDVAYLGPTSPERLGYPTQKPVGLLSRIIEASCPPDGIVLDPFCGCGTAIDASVRLDRRWIGIDITFIAVDLIRNRLRLQHGNEIDETYEVLGVPADLAAAHSLFERDPFEFERWAVSLVRGTPNQRQVGDRGRDGIIRLYQGKKQKPGQIVVSVKGGKQLNPSMVRDLEGTVAHDAKLTGGILITLWKATKGMHGSADTAGTFVDLVGNQYPLIQLITVEELLHGKKLKLPPVIPPYTDAKPVVEVVQEQTLFDF